MSYVVAILIFTLIIVAHELGHYFAAKRNGVFVEEFSVGMGPRVLSRRIGETRWSLKLFPIGGSCLMPGENGPSADGEQKDVPDELRGRLFCDVSVWRRMIIIVGGVAANILCAVVLSCFLSVVQGYNTPVLSAVAEGGAAEAAGLRVGDTVTKLDRKSIGIYEELKAYMLDAQGEPIVVHILRGGQKMTYTVTPKLEADGRYYLGIVSTFKKDFGGGLVNGLKKSVYYVTSTYAALAGMFTGKYGMSDMSGPVGIVSVMGQSYTEAEASTGGGTSAALLLMVWFAALLSANLAVANLLPLPALDGGRLVFLIIEAVRKKPVKAQIEGMVHTVGFMLLMGLVLFIAAADIRRLL